MSILGDRKVPLNIEDNFPSIFRIFKIDWNQKYIFSKILVHRTTRHMFDLGGPSHLYIPGMYLRGYSVYNYFRMAHIL